MLPFCAIINKNPTMEIQTIYRIKISKIRPIIPNLLYNKLELLGFDDIEGALNINISEFKKGNRIGEKVVAQLIDLPMVREELGGDFTEII
jgi:hypothetical protein